MVDNFEKKPVNTLKNQLGFQWDKLHPNIQQRFDREPVLGEKIIYEGTMLEVRRSFMGWMFACFTRIIGNPLSSYQGRNIPTQVALFKREGRKGVFWERTYLIPKQKPYVVTSSKQESDSGEMLECVGGGFGMKLRVYEKDQQLHFKSYHYFFIIFDREILLPHWITPGETHVIHTDLGQGDFSFMITMNHLFLGETFFQIGNFHRKQD